EVFLATLSAELEGLQYKRSVLTEEGRTLARLASLVGAGAENGTPPTFALEESARIDLALTPSHGQSVPDGALGALLLAQEADRSRLALMLHDHVAQPLHNLVLQTEVLPRVFKA